MLYCRVLCSTNGWLFQSISAQDFVHPGPNYRLESPTLSKTRSWIGSAVLVKNTFHHLLLSEHL